MGPQISIENLSGFVNKRETLGFPFETFFCVFFSNVLHTDASVFTRALYDFETDKEREYILFWNNARE